MAVVEGWQGRFFEDFVVGDVYQHPLGRTVGAHDGAAVPAQHLGGVRHHASKQVSIPIVSLLRTLLQARQSTSTAPLRNRNDD